jgi:hypothetical protein
MNALDAKKRVNVMGVLSSIALGFQLVMVMVAVGAWTVGYSGAWDLQFYRYSV